MKTQVSTKASTEAQLWRKSRRCATCGHLGTQHAYTSSGKRCIGENWGCRCPRRPLSLVMLGAVVPECELNK